MRYGFNGFDTVLFQNLPQLFFSSVFIVCFSRSSKYFENNYAQSSSQRFLLT